MASNHSFLPLAVGTALCLSGCRTPEHERGAGEASQESQDSDTSTSTDTSDGDGTDGTDSPTPPVPPERVDEDGDGFDSATDCDDVRSGTNPGAIEVPGNDIDENCDGLYIPVETPDWERLSVGSDMDVPAFEMRTVACVTARCVLGLFVSRNPEESTAPPGYYAGDPALQMYFGWAWKQSSLVEADGAWRQGIGTSLTAGGTSWALPTSGWVTTVLGDDDAGFPQVAGLTGVYADGGEGTVVATFGIQPTTAPQVTRNTPGGPPTGYWMNGSYSEEPVDYIALSWFSASSDTSIGWGETPAELEFRFSHLDSTRCLSYRSMDTNGDGVHDLLCAESRFTETRLFNPWRVHLGPVTADTQLENPELWFTALMGDFAEDVGDLTGDGISEVAFGIQYPGAPFHGQVLAIFDLHDKEGEIAPEDALAVFLPASDHEMMERPNIAAGDFDGDGVRDLIITAAQIGVGLEEEVLNAPPKGRVSFFRGPIAGTYRPEDADRIWLGPAWDDGFGTGLVVGEDWDGDGRADLMVGAGFSVWDHSYPGAIWITPLDLGGE